MATTVKTYIAKKNFYLIEVIKMDTLYFPKVVYEDAIMAFLKETGADPNIFTNYCRSHFDFFVEVAFSFVEGTEWPIMETT